MVCDRYLPSSLVLQGIDGIESDTVWRRSAGAYVPDVAVLLNAGHPVIADRPRQRGAHSRFERQPGSSRAESGLYHRAAAELHAAGWPVMALDCTIRRRRDHRDDDRGPRYGQLPGAEPGMPELSLLTLNIANPSPERAKRQLGWLAARDEDALVLTETKDSAGCRLLADAFSGAGYRLVVRHRPLL